MSLTNKALLFSALPAWTGTYWSCILSSSFFHCVIIKYRRIIGFQSAHYSFYARFGHGSNTFSSFWQLVNVFMFMFGPTYDDFFCRIYNNLEGTAKLKGTATIVFFTGFSLDSSQTKLSNEYTRAILIISQKCIHNKTKYMQNGNVQ